MSANFIIARPNLSWFIAAVSEQRHKVADLLARTADLNVLGNIKPAILGKLFKMLEQVAAAKREEVRLLGQIEAIEQQHLKKRHKGWLKTLRAEEAEIERKKLMLAWATEDNKEEECDKEYDDEKAWGNDDTLTDRAVRIDYETCDIREGSEEAVEKHNRFLWFVAYWALMT